MGNSILAPAKDPPAGSLGSVADAFFGLQLRKMPSLEASMMYKKDDLIAIWRAGDKMIYVPKRCC
jgi:hypothetical protein